MSFPDVLFLLVFLHYLADFGLQSSFIALGKNRFKPIEGTSWVHPMAAHCFIHAGFVYLATGFSLRLAVLELVCHFLIDHSKCKKSFGEHTDQALHITCKVAWALLLVYAPEWVR